MSDNDNVSVRQSYIQTKIELAFAAGMSMSFYRSVQHDFILTYAAFGSQPEVIAISGGKWVLWCN